MKHNVAVLRKKSLYKATSMGREEVIEWVRETPLFFAMYDELCRRGVNVDNILEVFTPKHEED